MEFTTNTTHNVDGVVEGTSPTATLPTSTSAPTTATASQITVIPNRQGGGAEGENEYSKQKEDETATTKTRATTFNGNKGKFCVQSYHRECYPQERVDESSLIFGYFLVFI